MQITPKRIALGALVMICALGVGYLWIVHSVMERATRRMQKLVDVVADRVVHVGGALPDTDSNHIQATVTNENTQPSQRKEKEKGVNP